MNKEFFLMKLFTALLLIVAPAVVLAQKYKLNERYPGYFINANGDTIRGYILIINKLDNQAGGEYSNDSKGEKIKIFLLPDEVKGFKVQDRVYTAVEYGDPDEKPRHFLLTLAEGELNLYQYFRLSKDLYVGTGTGQRPATGDDEQYLQSEFIIVNRLQKKFVITNENSLLKQAEEIFMGDDSIIQQIKDKEKGFKYNDLPELVKQFNAR